MAKRGRGKDRSSWRDKAFIQMRKLEKPVDVRRFRRWIRRTSGCGWMMRSSIVESCFRCNNTAQVSIIFGATRYGLCLMDVDRLTTMIEAIEDDILDEIPKG